jgi:mannose-binding lectin 2
MSLLADHPRAHSKLDNVTIPARPYLGFSAATGDVSDNHDIVSVSTSNIIYKERTAAEKKAHRLEHFPPGGAAKAGEKKKSGGWFSKKKKQADSGTPSSGTNRDTPSGPGFFAGFFSGLFSLIWFVLKWASVLGVIAGAAYGYFRWQKKKDVSRACSTERWVTLTSCAAPRPSGSKGLPSAASAATTARAWTPQSVAKC